MSDRSETMLPADAGQLDPVVSRPAEDATDL